MTDSVNGDTIDTSGTASGSVDAGGFEAGAMPTTVFRTTVQMLGDGSGYDFQTVEDAIEIVGTAGASEAAELVVEVAAPAAITAGRAPSLNASRRPGSMGPGRRLD